MQVTIHIDARRAIESGVNAGFHRVEIEADALSAEERKAMAGEIQTTSDGIAHICGPSAPTAEAIVAWIRALIAERAEAARKQAQERAAATEGWLAQPIDRCINNHKPDEVTYRYNWVEINISDPRVQARMPEIKAEIARRIREAEARNAEAAAARAKADAEKAARAKAAEQAMKTWALVHGSELLRERIAGAYNWRGLATREYADQICAALPGAWTDEPDDWACKPRTNPTLTEIRARKALAPLIAADQDEPGLIDAELLWVSLPDTEDGDEVPPITAMRISVRCPDGATIQRVQRIEQ